MRNYFPKRPSGTPLHTLSKLYDVPVGFVASPFVYCFICGRRRVAVARYRMICLVYIVFVAAGGICLSHTRIVLIFSYCPLNIVLHDVEHVYFIFLSRKILECRILAMQNETDWTPPLNITRANQCSSTKNRVRITDWNCWKQIGDNNWELHGF